MQLTIDLYGNDICVSIKKNKYYTTNTQSIDYSPYEEPYEFEIQETLIRLDDLDRDTLFQKALEYYHEY